MSKKITLYQRGESGKIKTLIFWTEGAKFFTRWGQLDGKMQETVKECVGMNEGKANETSPAEQAIAEMKAKIVIKKKEGYDTKMPPKNVAKNQTKIDLDNIPEAFCPNKPISATPKSIIDGADTYGQRKFDGHCLFLVKGNTTEKIYSRRMEDMSASLKNIPEIKNLMARIPKGTFLMTEFTYYNNLTKRESPRHLAAISRSSTEEKALERYQEFLLNGKFNCVPFDILFFEHKCIGNVDYLERHAILTNLELKPPPTYNDWRKRLEDAKNNNWEGFVLRVPGEKSHISFTLDGEAHRAGSYKHKFIKTDDFYVTSWLKGKSGKHAAFYAKFAVAQNNSEGTPIDRGYVGPGRLTHDELAQLTKDLDAGVIKKNFVVEAEYQAIQDSGKLQFGIIQRLRPDKVAEECVAEE